MDCGGTCDAKTTPYRVPVVRLPTAFLTYYSTRRFTPTPTTVAGAVRGRKNFPLRFHYRATTPHPLATGPFTHPAWPQHPTCYLTPYVKHTYWRRRHTDVAVSGIRTPTTGMKMKPCAYDATDARR